MKWSWRKALGLTPAPTPLLLPVKPPERINPLAIAEAQRGGRAVADPVATFTAYRPAPGVVPALAMDSLPAVAQPLSPIGSWAASQAYHEGLAFLGYPYLAELAQRAEYRMIAEKWAEHATRKWIKLRGHDEKVKAIGAELDRLNVRAVFREAAEQDGLFGRSQVFLDFGDADNATETQAPLVTDTRKVNKRRPLQRLKNVEPMWSYPAPYRTGNPLAADFYRPHAWYVFGLVVHSSRLLTFVGREVPDMLKPAYAFGGLSMTQMAKPYVDNWLRARQSVSDLLHSFNVPVLKTDMTQVLTGGAGADLFARVDIFNATRDNRGTMVLDKNAEDFSNVSTSLASLDKLQAQAQEQLSSVSGIPLVILLGVTPSGLNASSDGEVRSFYAAVKAYQEKVFRAPLKIVLDLVQLSLFDQIDPEIGFDFEDLWEMSDTDKAAIRKSDAEADATYINAGVVDPEEARERLRNDETSLYHGVDLTAPAPEPAESVDGGEEEDGLELLRAA